MVVSHLLDLAQQAHEKHSAIIWPPQVAALCAVLPPLNRVLEIGTDRKSTRLNSSHLGISYAVFCLKKKKKVRVTDFIKSRPSTESINQDRSVDAHVHDQSDALPTSLPRSYLLIFFLFFFFNDTATTEIYTLSLHDALPIWMLFNVPGSTSSLRWPAMVTR